MLKVNICAKGIRDALWHNLLIILFIYNFKIGKYLRPLLTVKIDVLRYVF